MWVFQPAPCRRGGLVFSIKKMKFAATADWHIRSRHLGVSRRGRDFTDAALRAIEAANAENCEFMVNGGDTFNENRPSSENVKALKELHECARHFGLPILLIDGNHDYAEPSWYDTIFTREEKLESLSRGGICRITGERLNIRGLFVAGLKTGDREALLLDLAALPKTDIVLWHGAIQEMAGFPGDNMPSLAEIPAGKFQALICGDIHRRQWVGGQGATIIGYPGATELVKRDEPLEHSITVFDTSPGPDKWTWYEKRIDTRPVLARQVRDVEQLERLILELRHLPKDPWPVVLVRFDRGVPDVKTRLFQALDNPEAIMRIAQGPAVSSLNIFGGGGSEEPLKKPAEFLHLVQHDSSMGQLLAALCVDPSQAKNLIETWVDGKMSEIKKINATN